MFWLSCCRSVGSEVGAADHGDALAEPVVGKCQAEGLSAEAENAWRLTAIEQNIEGKVTKSTKAMLHLDNEKPFTRTNSCPSRFASSPAMFSCQPSDSPVKRKDKRAQTMPATMETRRVSINISKEATTKLERKKKARKETMNLAPQKPHTVTDVEIEQLWRTKTDCHVRGVMKEGQRPEDQRPKLFFGPTQLPGKRPPCISCMKGCKGADETSPNQDESRRSRPWQPDVLKASVSNYFFSFPSTSWLAFWQRHALFKRDFVNLKLAEVWDIGAIRSEWETRPVAEDNFSITYFKNGYTLACVFDGHGDCGHLVSTRTVQTVPYFLAKSTSFPADIEGAFVEAFGSADKDVEALALEEDWDVMGSGATATAVLWHDDQIWTAHCGDSRCLVSSVKRKRIVHETEDHKPDTEAEKARIDASGGQVITKTYNDGFKQSRMYIKGEDYPGLAMSRALGDVCAKDHGVIAVPEVSSVKVDISTQPFFIVSSDGVWEFISSQEVADGVADLLRQESAEVALQGLHEIALERWEEEEGDYCDDITSILVQLT